MEFRVVYYYNIFKGLTYGNMKEINFVFNFIIGVPLLRGARNELKW